MSVGHRGGGTRMKLTFEDGTVYIAEKASDTFFTGFNRNLFLRESCYQCQYCGMERITDFTIADFWGCPKELLSEEEQKEGVSVIVCNTEKAESILIDIRSEIELTQIDSETVIRKNKAFSSPQNRPNRRSKFFSVLKILGYDRTVEILYARKYFPLYMKHFVRRAIGDERYNSIKRIFGK